MCFILQLIHMIILLWNNFCLFYMLYAAMFDKKGNLLKIAYITISIEVFALLIFRLDCPLTLFQWYLYPGTSPVALIPAILVKNSTVFGLFLIGIFFAVKFYKIIKRDNNRIKLYNFIHIFSRKHKNI